MTKKNWNNFYLNINRQFNADLNFLTLLYRFNNRRNFDKKKFLILGAGDGPEAFEIARNKSEVWASDFSKQSVKRLKLFNSQSKPKLKKILLMDQRDMSILPDNFFDYVVSWSVITYINRKDGKIFFENIKKKMKKKGRMIILFSNFYKNLFNGKNAMIDKFKRTFYSETQAIKSFSPHFKIIAKTKVINFLPPAKKIKMSRSLFLLESK